MKHSRADHATGRSAEPSDQHTSSHQYLIQQRARLRISESTYTGCSCLASPASECSSQPDSARVCHFTSVLERWQVPHAYQLPGATTGDQVLPLEANTGAMKRISSIRQVGPPTKTALRVSREYAVAQDTPRNCCPQRVTPGVVTVPVRLHDVL